MAFLHETRDLWPLRGRNLCQAATQLIARADIQYAMPFVDLANSEGSSQELLAS
jgi:hypothetical protein